jgi:hypothetical protein
MNDVKLELRMEFDRKECKDCNCQDLRNLGGRTKEKRSKKRDRDRERRRKIQP